MLFAACGSSSPDASSSGSGPLPKLRVVVATTDPSSTPVFVAKQAGLFAAEGVDVDLTVAGANTVTSVTSGQADIAQGGALAPITVAKQGKDTAILFWALGNKAAGFVVGKPGITSLDQCKTVITSTEATSPFGWVTAYKRALGLDYRIIASQDVPAISATVAAGTNDCGGSTYGQFTSGIAAGKMSLIIDPRDPSKLPAAVRDLNFIDSGFWGMKANLPPLKDQLVRFVRGMEKAMTYIKDHTGTQLAELLYQREDWKAIPKADLAQLIDSQRFAWLPDGGRITEQAWAGVTTFVQNMGLTYVTTSDPTWSYASRVDMSYLDAATR